MKCSFIGGLVGVLAVAALSGALGCSNPTSPSEPAASQRSELINGTPAPGDYVGLVRIAGDVDCSGLLVTNQWAITARHCISSVLAEQPDQIMVFFGGTRSEPAQVTTAAEVVRSPPGPDLALLRLSTPMIVNGAPYGLLQRPYPSYANYAQGINLFCVGWGSTGALNPPTPEPNVASTAVMLDSVTPPLLGLEMNTQPIATGDAGGPCDISYTDGEQLPIGIMAGLFTDGGKGSSVAIDLTQPGTRTWAESTLVERDADVPANAASIPHALSPDGQLIDLFWVDGAGQMNGSQLSPDGTPSSSAPQLIGGSSDDPFAPVRPAAAYIGTDLHILGRTVSGRVLEGIATGVAAVSAWTPLADLPAISSGLGISNLGTDRFDVLARSAAGPVVHAWFVGGAWAPNEMLGGSFDEDILGNWNYDPHSGPVLQLLGVSLGNVQHKDLYVSGWTPGGTDWATGDVNGVIASACVMLSANGTTLDLFARGTNGHLVHKYTDGGWVNDFIDLGLAIPDEPSAVIAGARAHVFARNPDGTIWHAHFPR